MNSNPPPDAAFDSGSPERDDPFTTRGAPASSARFLGDYRLVRQLGRGGMGVVYEAVPVAGGAAVALKTLQRPTAGSLRRFKDEFRVLADLEHRNLVRLGELVTTSEEPFFTMEIVQGQPFDQYVRAGHDSVAALPHLPFNEHRLRDGLRQLADGLTTLHQAGCIHRDLKPSNVLVTHGGRVVILDFGLALEQEDAALREHQLGCVGTPYYMSPEQARSRALSTASDWYSVGIMLYESLTGERAFQSRQLSELMQEKLTATSLRPRDVLSEIPNDLDQLCVDLLAVEPERRPTSEQVLVRMQGQGASVDDGDIWIGREQEIGQLVAAWDDVQSGQTRVVLISGNSGMGKTSLADRFLSRLRQTESVVVLRGRCYDNESVAYQGFDSIVDSLAAHLQRLPPVEVDRILPLELDALCQIFPVLTEVPSIARDIASRPSRRSGGRERRRLGMLALREMLSRLSRWSRLVIFVDDLQQGDSDTAALFRAILVRDQAPESLFLATYRSEDATTSECLRQVRRCELPPSEQLQLCDQTEIRLDRFSPEDATQLARRLLARGGVDDVDLAQRIAEEAAGDPLFIRLLARHVRRAGSGEPVDEAPPGAGGEPRWTLGSVIWSQVSQLEPVFRSTLQLLAAAGRPIDQQAIEASLADELPPVGLVRSLRAKRLVRRLGDHRLIETFHDKIRETVLLRMSPEELRIRCVALARHLEARPQRDVEFLADLYRRGGELALSGEYYVQAAEVADRSLAFSRAVEYYRYALAQLPLDRSREQTLRVRFGDALANASRASEAAEQYLLAAESAAAGDRLALYQRAALRWLTSGHVDRGVAALKVALEGWHLPWPRTTAHAAARLLLRTAQLRARGLRPTRNGPPIDATAQQQLDACWSAAAGLSVVDPVRGSYFVAENLYRSLSKSGSWTLVRDLAVYMGHVAIGGNRSRKATRRVLLASRELVQQSPDPYSRAMLLLARGIASLLRGEWTKTVRCCDRAVEYLQDQEIHGASWELNTARTFSLWALQYQGDLLQLSRRQPELMRVAQETNDLFATLNFGTQVMAHLQLAADDPDEAWRRLEDDRARLSVQGFFVQHHNELLARTFTRIYQGRGVEAWQIIDGQWKRYRHAFLSQVQQIRVDHLQVATRALLAAAAELQPIDAERSRSLLRQAAAKTRRLRREKVAWAEALAVGLEAAAAEIAGDRQRSVQLFDSAAEHLDRVRMRLFATAARHHRDALCREQAGDHDAVTSAWRGMGVAEPCRMASMLFPLSITTR